VSYPVICVSADELSAPLPGDRVLTLRRDGHGLRLALIQLDGPDRRQAGGLTLPPEDCRHFLMAARALLDCAAEGGL
jgi:hypothetical protein